MKMRLTRLQSNHNNLRTDTIVGEAVGIPMVGSNFVMVADALVEGHDYRLVTTTLIKAVMQPEEKVYEFATANSSYRVEVLE